MAATTLQDAVRRLPKRARKAIPSRARNAVRRALGRYRPWEFDFALNPSDPGPGEFWGPPDFVGIGVQRGGSTWWFDLITRHPDVKKFDTLGDLWKERHFFTRFGHVPFGESEIELYNRSFPRRAGMLAGEWTPDYVLFPWIPPLLVRTAPKAKLLMIVRDPVERFWSGIWHERFYGVMDSATLACSVARGRYFSLLSSWLGVFPEEQLLVLQYEQCVARPRQELTRTYEFLGLNPGFMPEGIERGVHQSGSDRARGVNDDVRGRLVNLYADDVELLMTNFKHLDQRLWPNFQDR